MHNKSQILQYIFTFPRKAAILLDFIQIMGVGVPCPIFWHFFISAIMVNKRSLFPPKCQQLEL